RTWTNDGPWRQAKAQLLQHSAFRVLNGDAKLFQALLKVIRKQWHPEEITRRGIDPFIAGSLDRLIEFVGGKRAAPDPRQCDEMYLFVHIEPIDEARQLGSGRLT